MRLQQLLIIPTLFMAWCLSAQNEDQLSFRERLEEQGVEYQGFWSNRQNVLVNKLPSNKDFNLSESRFQFNGTYYKGITEWQFKTDFVWDGYTKKLRLDVREANLFMTPYKWMDIKLGRQIITWGKGDFIFINDLFPKDFQAFFIGRELEYLKGPSDALRVNLYAKSWQLNIIYTPQFDPDIFPTGERISFFDPTSSTFNSENLLAVDVPSAWFTNDEVAFRLSKNVKGIGLALYGYHGYWKSPSSFNPLNGQYGFPTLNSFGFSADATLMGGVSSLEVGWYLSEDNNGDNPLINNSQFRWLLGYSRDLKANWSLGLQFYQELTLDYKNLTQYLPPSSPTPDRARNMITARLQKSLNQQKWTISLFTFYNAGINDAYLRPSIAHKLTDSWKIDLGGNFFVGDDPTTFWNQFKFNNNIYLGLKWSY